MTAALPMGNQKITGLADPTVSTDAVTKNYADTQVASFFSTGDVKLTLKITADTGWILVTSSVFGNGTIGSGSSGANIRANADCQNLFTLVYNVYRDVDAPLTTSTGAATTRGAQGSAATAWAANCRVQVGFFAGRAIGIAGNPADLATNRTFGDHTGAETFTLAAGNIPTITATNASQAISVSPSSGFAPVTTGTITDTTFTTGSGHIASTTGIWGGTNLFSGNNSISTTYTNASPTAVSLFQPTTFVNAMVKL